MISLESDKLHKMKLIRKHNKNNWFLYFKYQQNFFVHIILSN